MIKLAKLVKPRKRVGRGIAAGGGKTAGRGTKGQRSRTGFKAMVPKHLLKLPKLRGFKGAKGKPLTISYRNLTSHFRAAEKVTRKRLIELGLSPKGVPVKIVGPVTDDKKLRFLGVKVTKSFHDK